MTAGCSRGSTCGFCCALSGHREQPRPATETQLKRRTRSECSCSLMHDWSVGHGYTHALGQSYDPMPAPPRSQSALLQLGQLSVALLRLGKPAPRLQLAEIDWSGGHIQYASIHPPPSTSNHSLTFEGQQLGCTLRLSVVGGHVERCVAL